MENPRSVVKLLEHIEKARKLLSSTSDAQISIDPLLNDEDLNRTLKRDEFESIIAPFVQRFKNLIMETIALSGYKQSDISSVEMLGDATRTPIILETTK